MFLIDKGLAVDLLKAIIDQDTYIATDKIKPFYQKLLNDYNQDPIKNWNTKIIAISLIFASEISAFSHTCK